MKNIKFKILMTIKSFIAVSALATLTVNHADDTEIFFTENISNNLLFLLDTSGSMREEVVTTTVVGGGTSSTGGSIVDVTGTIAGTADDATQTFEEQEEASAGAQTASEDFLEFQPDNIVATRYRLNGNSILGVGQNRWYWNWWGYNSAKVTKTRISNAYLTFYSASTDSDNSSIKITVEDAATDYANSNYSNSDYINYYYHNDYPTISNRPVGSSVTWTPSGWNQGGTDTVDVTSLVQQVVDRSDWNKWNGWYANSFAFKFETESGKRVAYAYDGDSSLSPELNIDYEYDIEYRYWSWSSWQYEWTTATINENDHFTYTKNSYDDAEQEWVDSTSSLHLHENQLALDDEHLIGLRFNLDNAIPQGSVVTEAFLELTSDGNYTQNSKFNIQIENTGDAVAYSDANPIVGRQYHSGSQLDWTPGSWSADGTYASPELTLQVQQVVDNGNANVLAFRLFNELAVRNVYSKDGDSSHAPVLHIKYQDIGGATSGTGTGTGGTTVITEVNTRLEIMQQALENVLQTAPEVNVGLMKYSGMDSDYYYDGGEGYGNDKRHHYAGGVVYPISPIYEPASDHIGSYENRDNLLNPGNKKVREFLPEVAYQWEATGGTPIVDALYEAALYFRGEKAHYGRTKNNNQNKNSTGAHPASLRNGAEISDYVGYAGRSNLTNPTYKSPIINECQSTYLVLMSDGEPTYYYHDNGGSQAKGPFARYVEGNATGFSGGLATEIKSGGNCYTGNGEPGNNSAEKFTAGTCGREITQFLANNDQMPDNGRGGNKGVEGEQTVKTFAIGFGHGLTAGAEDYLRSLVTVDGNGYFKADHKQELETAFTNILETVSKATNSLSSPGYSVNVKSGLEHEDDIYIPVFDRKNSSRWSGNLKKFKLVDDGNGKRKIQGKNNKDAFDEYGVFTDDALDYWSQSPVGTPDGFEVEKGGVANWIDPIGRKIFSDLVCSNGCELNTGNNKLVTSNNNITTSLMGIDNNLGNQADRNALKKTLINFMRGWENGLYNENAANAAGKGVKRHYMGDMLHTEPLVITYKQGNSAGNGKEQYIFAATNEGYLHAFKTTGTDAGKEKFAFIPKILLQNSYTLYDNKGTARDHKYGIDGTFSYWHDDANKNGDVDTGEKVHLYFGLRRGGRAYYALDISDINNPKVLWSKNSDDAGMGLLGQTWSPPYLTRVGMSDGSKKEVVIVSGGYDTVDDRDLATKPKVLDDSTTAVTASMGKNIYIMDMHSGELLWDLVGSMGKTNTLKHSIPGGVEMVDVNSNGLTDRLYFADTGGFVWRLDLSEKLSKTSDDKSKLTKFASLGGAGVNARKFYNQPDVSRMSPNGKTIYAVSIGSGFRAHPNDKVIQDKFFVLKDVSPFEELADNFAPIEMDKMANVSVSGSEGNISLDNSEIGTAGKDKGWYLSFPNNSGEKVLASAETIDGIVTFTSMVPKVQTENVDVCKAPVSEGRFYALNIRSAKAGMNLDDSEESNYHERIKDDKDTFVKISTGEIPGKPQVVFNGIEKSANNNATICKHPVDLRSGKKLSQISGYDACRLESIYWNDPEND